MLMSKIFGMRTLLLIAPQVCNQICSEQKLICPPEPGGESCCPCYLVERTAALALSQATAAHRCRRLLASPSGVSYYHKAICSINACVSMHAYGRTPQAAAGRTFYNDAHCQHCCDASAPSVAHYNFVWAPLEA